MRSNLRPISIAIVVAIVSVLATTTARADSSKTGFGFDARSVSGFPSGVVKLDGGGAFDTVSGFVHSGGGFRCVSSVNQGPLNGCLAGEGVRWDAESILASTGFKCLGGAGEALKTASTGDGVIVLHADFYRAGDGNDESFTANMIVAESDLAPDLPGVQTVWLQGVGCAEATAHFSA